MSSIQERYAPLVEDAFVTIITIAFITLTVLGGLFVWAKFYGVV